MDLTENEKRLLKLIFDIAQTMVDGLEDDFYPAGNTLFYLKEKLGISDIVDND